MYFSFRCFIWPRTTFVRRKSVYKRGNCWCTPLLLVATTFSEMSHETAVLPLNQAKAYLEDKPLRASISKQGIVLATVYDYVFRTKSDVFLSNMNFWTFTATQETGKLNKSTQSNDEVIYNYYTTLILFAYHLYFYQEFK